MNETSTSVWLRMSWRERGIWIGVILFTVLTRFWHLGSPQATIFDEVWYVPDASIYLGKGSPKPWPIPQPTPHPYETTWLHPPLAKQIIAWFGVGPFPHSMFGIRTPSALAGCAVVLLVGGIAYRVWGSFGWAAGAALLAACDGMVLLHSRLATLDVFMCAFGLGAVFVALGAGRVPGRHVGMAWVQAWALAGAVVACKWSGASFVVVVAVIAWRRRRHGAAAQWLRWAVLVAPMVYFSTYWRYLRQPGVGPLNLLLVQWWMLRVQTGASLGPSPVASRWWEWMLPHRVPIYEVSANYTGRPSPFWAYAPAGNPALWWAFLIAVPVLAWLVWRRRDRVAGMVLVMLVVNLLPYVTAQRNTYIYYLLPAVCLYPLGVLAGLRQIPVPWRRSVGIGLGLAVAVCAVLAVPYVYIPSLG